MATHYRGEVLSWVELNQNGELSVGITINHIDSNDLTYFKISNLGAAEQLRDFLSAHIEDKKALAEIKKRNLEKADPLEPLSAQVIKLSDYQKPKE